MDVCFVAYGLCWLDCNSLDREGNFFDFLRVRFWWIAIGSVLSILGLYLVCNKQRSCEAIFAIFIWNKFCYKQLRLTYKLIYV